MTRARLVLALVLVAGVAALEFWGGIRANSLALLTDGVHVCMDVFALGIALAALIGAQRPANRRKTFGYGRLEILGALLNGTVLLTATAFIAYEAVQRFFIVYQPQGRWMIAIAGIGLVVNLAVGRLLLAHGKENLNVRAALFHVAGDALGAFAVIVGGIAIALTHRSWIDPLLSLFVAAIIVTGVYRVLADAADVLLEAVPRGLDVEAVRTHIADVPGVSAVHDLHVWTIGTQTRALSAHVLVDDASVREAGAVVRRVDAELRERYSISHVTLQVECENCEADERVICTQASPSGTG